MNVYKFIKFIKVNFTPELSRAPQSLFPSHSYDLNIIKIKRRTPKTPKN